MAKRNSTVSKNYSCLLCSNPTDSTKAGRALGNDDSSILGDGEEEAKVLKTLCYHLMPKNQDDIPEQFTAEMFPFCTSCKDLVRELWECQEVLRKTLLRMAKIKTTIEKKVVDDVLETIILDAQMPSSAATSEKRFFKLRDVIFKHHQETLLIKREVGPTSIHMATSSPVSVLPEVNTAKATRSVIISSLKCDTDVNDTTRNEYAESPLPELSFPANEHSPRISQFLLDNDSLFEEEHHVLKYELHSESEVDDLDEDKGSENGGETKDQPCLNQVVAYTSPPGPYKPFEKTRKRMSNTGKSTQSSMEAQRKGPRQIVAEKRGIFRGTEYKILENKRVKCGCCNRNYSEISNFMRHVRKESHPCSVCKKILTQASHLKAHHYKFHGAGVNEKFPCPHCGFQYSHRGGLNRHLRRGCRSLIPGEMQ